MKGNKRANPRFPVVPSPIDRTWSVGIKPYKQSLPMDAGFLEDLDVCACVLNNNPCSLHRQYLFCFGMKGNKRASLWLPVASP